MLTVGSADISNRICVIGNGKLTKTALSRLAARRDKAVLVSFPFPITQVLLLISAEPSANIENLAKKVVEIFTDVK